ncbi:MAG: hypothetical protein HY647_03110, partial [Acidobacteria bacterium]|nr:hypothetical protein [Acidobacteriota bacterium]
MKISLGFVEQDRSGGRARSRRKRRVTAAGHGSLGALANLGDYGNSFGQSPKTRPKWSQKLSFKITDARKQPVEYLWYVGDFASLDPRLQQIARTVAEVFHHAGMDFGILDDGEKNS